MKVADRISNKLPVTSGVPQGSVLGPTLFVIFINDIVEILADLNVNMKLFADDVKMYSVVDVDISSDLQIACNRLVQWAEIWQMSVAIQKCNVLRVSNRNTELLQPHQAYCLDSIPLKWEDDCRDLGVMIDSKLSFNSHISLIVHKAHVRAQLILRTFTSRHCDLLTRAFTTYVRPLLEYCSPVWNPHTLCNINKIESVQRAFTKRLEGLSRFSYNDRLRKLNLETLELRRLKTDLVVCFKLLHGQIDSNYDHYFQLINYSSTRGHNYKLAKQFSRVNAHKFDFSNRIIDAWNSLPVDVVNAGTVSKFKSLLNQVSFAHFCVIG